MKELKTDTGANVVINAGDFKDAMELKNAIVKEIAKSGIDLSKIDFKGLSADTEITGSVLNSIINAVLFVDCSPLVSECLFKCMARCTYNKEKITPDTFEDVKARQDYYPIAVEVIKENISPFFRGVVSGLKSGFLKIS